LNITISGDAVAWYAAIVATASAFVGGYAVWRDRTRLKVRVRLGWKLAEPYMDYSTEETYIIIEVANVGRRPVQLNLLPFFKLRGQDKGLVVKGPWLPKDCLQEGESAKMLCKQDAVDLAKVTHVVVNDLTGRAWKARIPKRKA